MSMQEKVKIQIHPRAFAAFGEELVTNDSVAVLELVKNSYDAYAFEVVIEFGKDEDGFPFISIKDDGLGMTKEVIINAWATIATPFKKKKPIVSRVVDGQERQRVVSGNKGLGRFSAARLGNTMTMITKTENGPAMKAFFDWRLFDSVETIEDCSMTLEEVDNVEGCGTQIIISQLNANWDNEDRIDELKNELSRMVSPFSSVSDFAIKVITGKEVADADVFIKPKSFIEKPVYKIVGEVDSNGTILYEYKYDNGDKTREATGQVLWTEENYRDCYDLLDINEDFLPYRAGNFSFEIRAWDMDSESTQSVSERFNIGKRDLKASIKMYKGISVYRDNVLVLPKSEAGRDWLGLDAKRISQIGRRISTNQVIGIVNISNECNPNIKDTTDREKLADTFEYKQFYEAMLQVIDTLQRERNSDKEDGKKQNTLSEILTPLSSDELVESIEIAVEKGANTNEIVEYVRDYHERNELQLKELNDRLIYYAQTASLGSVAIVIMHEILTGMTCIKRFLDRIKPSIPEDKRTNDYYDTALRSHARILEVTNSFAPLYKRDLRKKIVPVGLKETADLSFNLVSAKKMSEGVIFVNELSDKIKVCMHESEIQTVFINLFDNSCYWTQENENERKITVCLESFSGGKAIISVNDNGRGILPQDAERVFVPGVTSKPKGIGMGLVIVTEIVKAYGGKVGVSQKGKIGGASIVLELPIVEE